MASQTDSTNPGDLPAPATQAGRDGLDALLARRARR